MRPVADIVRYRRGSGFFDFNDAALGWSNLRSLVEDRGPCLVIRDSQYDYFCEGDSLHPVAAVAMESDEADRLMEEYKTRYGYFRIADAQFTDLRNTAGVVSSLAGGTFAEAVRVHHRKSNAPKVSLVSPGVVSKTASESFAHFDGEDVSLFYPLEHSDSYQAVLRFITNSDAYDALMQRVCQHAEQSNCSVCQDVYAKNQLKH